MDFFITNPLQSYKFFFIYANIFLSFLFFLAYVLFFLYLCTRNRRYLNRDTDFIMEDSNQVLYKILLDRLDLLRTLDKEGDSDRRRHIARETKELHAPLAHRLGLYVIKTEMEDLSLKFLDYKTYKYIAHALNEKKAQRDAYITAFITPLEKKLKEQNETIYVLQMELSRIENQNSKLELETEHIQSKLWDEYELTYNTALEYKRDDFNMTVSQKEAASLRSQIKALGNINIDSIGQYKEVKERFDFLSVQKADLDETKKKLEDIIKDMQTIMTRQFKESFEINDIIVSGDYYASK